MFHVVTLDADVLAFYKTRAKRSEVLLYKRNEGFLSKLMLPEKGAALERRLHDRSRTFWRVRFSREIWEIPVVAARCMPRETGIILVLDPPGDCAILWSRSIRHGR